MRYALAILFVVSGFSGAIAQVCNGCGCRGGSGWIVVYSTYSERCVGCGEFDHLCGGEHRKRCKFAGEPNIKTICKQCPQHVPQGACPLK
jgi:hypothetical protein